VVVVAYIVEVVIIVEVESVVTITGSWVMVKGMLKKNAPGASNVPPSSFSNLTVCR